MEKDKQTVDFGTMSGIVIVVIILLFGAYYFAQQRMEKSKEFQATIDLGAVLTAPSAPDKISDIGN